MIRALAVTLFTLLAVPSAALAENATVSIGGSPGSATYTGSSARDAFFLSTNNPPALIFDRTGNGALLTAGPGCTDVFGNGTRLACSIVGGATINLGGGDDFFSGGFASGFTVNGGPGNDELIPSGGGMKTLNGDAGDDTFNLVTSPNRDEVNGGEGDDTFKYPDSLDVLSGGPGVDTIVLSAPTSLTLPADVENATGGDGDDELIGNALPNVLLGGKGNDTIEARDGVADTVDCGPGLADIAQVDRIDTVTGCETVDVPAAPVEETPVEKHEPEQQQQQQIPVPVVILQQPQPVTPTAVPSKVTARLIYGFVGAGRNTRLTSLELRELSDSTVEVKCSCFKAKRFTHKTGKLSLYSLVKGRKLRPGTTITITVSKPGFLSETRELEMVAKKKPVLTVR